MLDAKLLVVGGNADFDQIDLKLPVVIGRGTDVDLAMSDELISRRHVEIFEEKGRLLVRDLGSRNGTFVNNSRIQGVSSLEPEQLLTLGTVTFRAIYVAAEHLESTQLSETVRINFNETEPVLHPSRAEDLSRISTEFDQPQQDEIETVDLDEYLRRQSSGELPVDIAARDTTYANGRLQPKLPHAPWVATLSSATEPLENSAEHLKRRFPK